MQHTATHCKHTANTLQTHCNTLQHTTFQWSPKTHHPWWCTAIHYHTLQYAATHCNAPYFTLQHTATHCISMITKDTPLLMMHCNTLQYTAIRCNTLQHFNEYEVTASVFKDQVLMTQSPMLPQKSPTTLQKSPTTLQKSPTTLQKGPSYCQRAQ